MNEIKIYTIDVEEFKTDSRGRRYRIEGEDLAKEAIKFQLEHKCTYETALLAVSKT